MRVAGVDGCKGGWLVAIADWDQGQVIQDVRVVASFGELLALTEGCAAVAVDIPIGLSDGGPRRADLLARQLLAPRKTSSVFPAPCRPVLQAGSYDQAQRLSLASGCKSLTLQTFHILPKVRDADDHLTPRLQERICESHPEVSFRALNRGQAVLSKKRSAAGHAEREALLTPLLGADPRALTLPAGAARDDLYDACVLTWTALRLARGEAVRLPARPEYDGRGLRMEIGY